jgi:hypothetical protein
MAGTPSSQTVESLGEKIERMIKQLPEHDVTLLEIIDIVGNDGLLLLTVLLSLIFLVPVSIPGVSTVFGSAILLIGITRLLSRKLWLPAKIGHRRLPAAKLAAGFAKALSWFHRLEKISKPHRLGFFAESALFNLLNNMALILAAVLLMMPFGLIPFSNTFPAVAVIFLAIGMMQRDGGSVLLGHLANVATIAYFTALALGGVAAAGMAVGGG